MKYMILVSHGDFANGLHDALQMLAGKRDDVLSIGLGKDSNVDELAENFAKLIEPVTENDQILVLADLIGGSPLTTVLNVLNEKGFMPNTQIMGGMNLPLALTSVLMKDTFDGDVLSEMVLKEAHEGLREYVIAAEEDDDI
ncbi:MAG: PTS fructose transporter subunit IIA [Ileibacterium sp.]|nr:PTS fructose transporter subunit IIA [Ileibacterium sp.]